MDRRRQFWNTGSTRHFTLALALFAAAAPVLGGNLDMTVVALASDVVM